jgi:hypothetical protein
VAAAKSALAGVLEGVTSDSLRAAAGWRFADGAEPTGNELLLHAAGHLREHVGQAQLIRDLWLANSREGR